MNEIYDDDLDGLNHGPIAPEAADRSLPATTAEFHPEYEAAAYQVIPELDPVAAE